MLANGSRTCAQRPSLLVVTSYRPLKAYISRLGFARFCGTKYSAEVGDIDNMFVHLTNVAGGLLRTSTRPTLNILLLLLPGALWRTSTRPTLNHIFILCESV